MQEMPAASAASKRSEPKEEDFDPGAADRMRFAIARGINLRASAAAADMRSKQGAEDTSKKAGATAAFDPKKVQSLVQGQLLKLK